MLKFHINSLPISYQNYFQKVETIHNKSTRNSLATFCLNRTDGRVVDEPDGKV